MDIKTAAPHQELLSGLSEAAKAELMDLYDLYFGDKIDFLYDISDIMKILENNLSIRPFYDFLQRYIYIISGMRDSGVPYNKLSRRDCYAFIRRQFAANGMEDRASLDPEDPAALDGHFFNRLFTRETVGRDKVFLLAFGLGMNAEETSAFLTGVLRQSDFNFKDWQEAVYYYCLKKHLGYQGVCRYYKIFSELQPSEDCFRADIYTAEVEKAFAAASCEEEFIAQLARLKSDEKNYGYTRREVFLELLDRVKKLAADDRLTYLEDKDTALPGVPVAVSLYDVEKYIYYIDTRNENGNMLRNSMNTLRGRKWFLSTKLTRQNLALIIKGRRAITRNNIITLVFLNEDLWLGENDQPRGRLDDYMYTANDYLAMCRFAPVCFDNPYESFIGMCLMSDNPQDTFRQVWSESFLRSRGKIND